jgi:hypothetical protein
MSGCGGKRGLRIVAAVAVSVGSGIVFGFLPSCETTLTTLNPCGSIFAFCEPYQVDQIFADTPDFSLDPTCTIPFYGLDPANDVGDCSTTETFPRTPTPNL